MSDPRAENDVKKLARLEGNTICPNCGTQKKFGFSTVCIKFLTFVCNECKASHAAYSHRCKSLTMSSWTAGEVLKLKKAGNNACRATWLAKAPPCGQGGRPQPGDDINKYKQFILDVYERKKYYSETPVAEPETQPDVIVGNRPQRKQTSSSKTRVPLSAPRVPAAPVRKPVVAAAPAPPKPVVQAQPVADLLSFGGEPETTIPTPVVPASAAPVFDPFNTGGGFTPAVNSRTNTAAPAPVTTNDTPFDPFGNSNAVAAPPLSSTTAPAVVPTATTNSAVSSKPFDPFGNNSNGIATTTSTTSDFGAFMTTPASAPTQGTAAVEEKKAPVMNHNSASKVSAMGFHMTGNNNNNGSGTMMGGVGMNNQGGTMMGGVGMNNQGGPGGMPNMMMMQQQQQQQMMMMNGMQGGMGMSMGMGMNPNSTNNVSGMTMNNTMMQGAGGMTMMNNNMASMSLNNNMTSNINMNGGSIGMNSGSSSGTGQSVMNFGGSQTGNTISQMSSKSTPSEPQKPDPFASLF